MRCPITSILGLLVLIGSAAAQPTDATATGTAVTLPTYGIEFTLPGEWTKQPEKHGGMVARWSPANANPDDNFFEVVALALSAKGAIGRAEDDVQRWGGKIEEGTIGGRRAYRVVVAGEAFVTAYCTRGEILYSVGYRHMPADQRELNSIFESWKWLDAESPSKLPDFQLQRVSVMERMSLELPSWMRPEKLDSGEPMFGGYSYASGRIQTHLHIVPQIRAEDAGIPLDQLADALGKAMAQMAKLPAPVAFKPLGESHDRMISDPVKSSDGGIKMTRIAVVALDAQTRATLRMHVFASRQQDQEAYAQLFEKMVASVKPEAASK